MASCPELESSLRELKIVEHFCVYLAAASTRSLIWTVDSNLAYRCNRSDSCLTFTSRYDHYRRRSETLDLKEAKVLLDEPRA